MKKRQHRATSSEAHDSIKEHKEIFYDKIIAALRRLKVGGTFEEISKEAGIKPDQAWKRIPELIDKGILYNVGTTRSTSSGRQAMVRQLVEIKIQERQDKPNEEKKEITFPKLLTQANLF